MKINIVFQKSGEKLQITEEDTKKTLLSVLQDHQIYLDAPCNGSGNCGRCKVRFIGAGLETFSSADQPEESSQRERRLLSEQELKAGIRLACFTKAEDGCLIEIPEDGQAEIAEISQKSRRAGESTENSIDEGGAAEYGVAVDLGTTTLAVKFVNLKTGNTEGVMASVNHQRVYGADVISRIQASNDGKEQMLQRILRDDLNRMIDELLQQCKKSSQVIKKIAIAGNTTICHLLLGYSCSTLGISPFTPVDISLQKKRAEEVLARKDICAETYILPGISVFVGADIVSGIYCCNLDLAEAPAMLLDIGTNGEMAIGNREGFFVTSAAAGPVFEGGNISCGVPGIPGAITHITIKDAEGTCSYETLGRKEPVGLCGTGIIDLTYELVRQGIVDANGTLSEPWFEEGFPITCREGRHSSASRLVFSQKDIREVQMGKSAIRAGIETLLKQYGACPLTVCLAGGFGYYMDIAKAERIGLFPDGFKEKAMALGNCSLEGAEKFLLEEDGEERVMWIASHAKEIHLANQDQFYEMYMQYMFFQNV